jgi:hypothetical protein
LGISFVAYERSSPLCHPDRIEAQWRDLALLSSTGHNHDMREKEIIFAVQECPEGGFEAHALGHSIFTQAETMEELKKMIQDVVRCHFDEQSRPFVIRLQ